MLEVTTQTTTTTLITGESINSEAEDDGGGDFLDLSSFASGASFSYQVTCHYQCESNNSRSDQNVPLSWRRPPYERHLRWSSFSSSDDDKDEEPSNAKRRVRFSTKMIQIREYEKPSSTDCNRLYYSCHELQKIVDDYRLEQQADQEFEQECSKLAAYQKQKSSRDNVSNDSDAHVCEEETCRKEQISSDGVSGEVEKECSQCDAAGGSE